MRFDSIEDMPPAVRRLYEKQMAKQGQNNTSAQKAPLASNLIPQSESKAKKRKYNNQPTERLAPSGECIKFGSKTEACYYDKLLLMERAGQVRKIRMQVEYLLQPSYTDGKTGERYRGIKYFADFVFEKLTDDGEWVEKIVDTKGGGRKGTETKTFVIKRKMMADMGYYVEAINKGEF